MDIIISIVIAIIFSFILYSIFDNRGYKAGLIFNFLLELGNHFLKGNVTEACRMGILYFFILLVIVFIIVLVDTSISYFIYSKTSSFFGYLIANTLIVFILSFVFSFILIGFI